MATRGRSDVGPLTGRNLTGVSGRHADCSPGHGTSSTRLRSTTSPNRTSYNLSNALIADQRVCDYERSFQDARAENDALHKHIEELEGRIAAFATKEKKFKLLVADHRKISEDLIITRETIEHVKNENADAKAHIANLERDLDTRDAVDANMDRKHTEELDAVSKRLAEVTNDNDILRAQVNESSLENQALDQALNRQEALLQIALMNIDRTEMENLLALQSMRMEALIAENHKLQGEKFKIDAQHKACSDEKLGYKSEIARHLERINELEQEAMLAGEMSRQVASLKTLNGSLEAFRQRAQQDLEEKDKQISLLQTTNDELIAKLHTAAIKNQPHKPIQLPPGFALAPKERMNIPNAAPLIEGTQLSSPSDLLKVLMARLRKDQNENQPAASAPLAEEGGTAEGADDLMTPPTPVISNIAAPSPNDVIGAPRGPDQPEWWNELVDVLREPKFRDAAGLSANLMRRQLVEGSVLELRKKAVGHVADVLGATREMEASLVVRACQLTTQVERLQALTTARDEELQRAQRELIKARAQVEERGTAEQLIVQKRKEWETETVELVEANRQLKARLQDAEGQLKFAQQDLEQLRDVRDKLASLDVGALSRLHVQQQSATDAVSSLLSTLRNNNSGSTLRPLSSTSRPMSAAGAAILGNTFN